MSERGEHTFTEIMSQPEVWQQAINGFERQAQDVKNLWDSQTFDFVLFTGCGSTYYLSQLGATLFQQELNLISQAAPGSEVALMTDRVLPPNTNPILIAVSRSGETTETLEAVRAFRAKTGNPVIAVTCYPDSALAKNADLVLDIPAAKEESLAQTRSFSSMAIVVEAMAGLLERANQKDDLQKLVTTVGQLLTTYAGLAQSLGTDQTIERFFFLGSSALYGIACEAMLKMKEMSLSYSEAYHVLEIRHGPMSMVNEETLVVGLISDVAAQHEAAVLKHMKAQGAQILALAEEDYGLQFADWSHFVHLQSGLPPGLRPIVYLPVLQLIAYHRAMDRGLNPDKPSNLEAFISLDALLP